jgi:hypothetical protein
VEAVGTRSHGFRGKIWAARGGEFLGADENGSDLEREAAAVKFQTGFFSCVSHSHRAVGTRET